MVADCLTKAMKETYLLSVLTSNKWDYRQTEEARATKTRKQLQRSRTHEDDSEPERLPKDDESEPEHLRMDDSEPEHLLPTSNMPS